MRRFTMAMAGAIVACLAVGAGPVSAHAPTGATHQLTGAYQVVDVGTLGGLTSIPTAINDRGDLVGYSKLADGNDHPFLWHAGHLTDLGTLGGRTAYAFDVNRRRDVVGYSTTADGKEHAFLWSRGTMTDLGTFGFAESAAYAINDTGTIVGSVTTTTGIKQPFRWQAGELTILPGGEGVSTAAFDINDAGQIVGSANTLGGPVTVHKLLLWNATTPTVLLSVGAVYATIGAPRINIKGDVVTNVTSSHQSSSFGWIDGALHQLAVPPNAMFCSANAINDQQQIVGGCSMSTGGRVPYLAQGYTSVEDLSAQGVHTALYDINNHGQLAGTVTHADSSLSAVIYTPLD